MKRALFILAMATVASSSFGTTMFFFGMDPNTSFGNPFPDSTRAQRDFAVIAGSMNSISTLTYENDPVGAGVTPYNPLPGLTISMTEAGGIGSGVNATDQHQLGWNTTPFGSKHLRFAGSFNALPAYVSFQFESLVSSFGTIYTGAESQLAGDLSLVFLRNGQTIASMQQSKPPANDQLTSHAFMGMATNDSNLFFDEVRFMNIGDRTNGSDHVGLDDTMFTYCNPVPEPATMAALGIGAIALLRRRKK